MYTPKYLIKKQKFRDDSNGIILASIYVLCSNLLLQVIIDFRVQKILSRTEQDIV